MKKPYLLNTALLEIQCAFPEDMMNSLAENAIHFRDPRQIDAQTVRIYVYGSSVSSVVSLARKHCAEVRVLRRYGAVPVFCAMGIRAIYPVFLFAAVLTVFWLQGHIWNLSVQGNETVPEEAILQALEQHGISFWTRTDSVDINKIKNEILSELPALGWITVNTEGGGARVIVRERQEKPVISRDASPANITARKDGMIEAIQTTNGQPAASPGDVVRAGDLLISGVLDLEQTMLLTRASGEILARTWNKATILLPNNRMHKQYTGRSRTVRSLTVGKTTINLYNSSRISYAEYDKIIEHTDLLLPGGFRLPFGWSRIVLREYIPQPSEASQEDAEPVLRTSSRRQLLQSMRAGTILREDTVVLQEGGNYRMICEAECREEIGIAKDIQD